jgi:hypothetical protein
MAEASLPNSFAIRSRIHAEISLLFMLATLVPQVDLKSLIQ